MKKWQTNKQGNTQTSKNIGDIVIVIVEMLGSFPCFLSSYVTRNGIVNIDMH